MPVHALRSAALPSALLPALLGLWAWPVLAGEARLVKDINAHTSPSSPDGFTEFAGKLFFAATDAEHGRELWALEVPASERFRRGDANADGAVDVSDAQSIIGFLFLGGAVPPCLDAADAEDGGLLDISDPIYLLGHLFLGGQPPPFPGPATCALDPTADALDCRDSAPCP